MLTQGESLEASEVGHGFDHQLLFRGLTFAVARGSSLALVGPSGAGKTTLLSILGGLIRPLEGSAVMISVDGSKRGPFRWTDVAWVFQGGNLFPWRTVLENVLVGVSGCEVPDTSQLLDRAHELIEEVGLSHRVSHPARVLSGGERQRLGIARALLPRPSFILADEPTAGMDVESGRVVLRLLIDIVRKEDAGLVLCTHDESVSGRLDRRLALA